MSSFFSDDEQEQESSREGTRSAPARRGRAAPRLARHLRSTTDPSSDPVGPITSSSSFFPHSSPEPGFDFQSNVGQAGSSRVVRRVVDGVRDELFAGVGDVPAGQALANVGIGLGDGGGDGDAEEEDEDENDVGRLTKVWVRERGTPEIMQWEGELVEECLHKMGQQAQMLDLLRSDPQTSSEEHFKLILVQTEMERVKYLVRAYLRCRLDKVEKFAQWIASSAGDDDARMQVQGRLSQLELSHAEKYAQLLHMHYNDSVLQSLPEKFRSLEVDFGTQRSMVRKPDMAQPVLIYCKKDLPDLILSTGERAGLAAKSMHLVRYDLVQRYIMRGDVEVL